jgi:hypothetical protein
MDGIGVYAVVDFGKNPLDVPIKRYSTVFVRFEPLIVFDDVQFELNGNLASICK